jgi:ribonuclease HI
MEDELVWQLSPFGDYSPKLGYSHLIIELQQQEPSWWWKGIWKVKCPLKEKNFMWCLIKKRVPMWDRMKKCKVEGPGWCALCKNDEESINHLFINCAFSRQCWKECSKILELDCRWEGDSVEEAWKAWLSIPTLKGIKVMPLILIWGIWLARNVAIFKEKMSLPELVVAQGINILTHFPQEKEVRRPRQIFEEVIDQSQPWDFFDGASQNNGESCGGGVVLFLTQNHYFKISMGLGPGTNNRAELMALKLLLLFVVDKNISSLQIFGDSLLVISWIQKTQRCHNILLAPLIEEIFRILIAFDTYSIRHVYRERNREADALSKQGLQIAMGQWECIEYQNGSMTSIGLVSVCSRLGANPSDLAVFFQFSFLFLWYILVLWISFNSRIVEPLVVDSPLLDYIFV